LSTMTYIGVNGGSPWPDNSLTGSTLDFRIYGQSVTSDEVASLFSAGSDASTPAIAAIVPEPGTMALSALGGLGLMLWRRRQAK